MADWNSAQYLKFKRERTQPSIDLAARIDMNFPSNIIDIGCGPGNSSFVVKQRFPDAKVLGVDLSKNMLERAKNDYPDIDFKLLDVSQDSWELDDKFDIAFSNACIQWVPNHTSLLPRIMNILNDGGKMAVQIPFQYDEPIHKIIGELVRNGKWRKKFKSPRIFYTLSVEEYYDILSEISSDFEMWFTIYCHRMKSHDDIIEWYKGTGLKPYLEALNEDEKNEFISDVLSEVKKCYNSRKNGEVIFRFPRLFFIATK